MATDTAATTTTMRTTSVAMCTLTIDCRCETCIEGRIRYQWPRIIAVDAPPRSAAELRTLATVSTVGPSPRPPATPIACAVNATRPPTHATPTIAGRTDASARPTVAQYRTGAA